MKKERYIKISESLQLRLIIFPGNVNKVVYFLPGWIVDLKNFMPFILPLQEAGFTVKYVETREKKSSIFTYSPKRDDFLITLYANDLERIIELEGDEQFQLLGSSLGAHIVMHYLKDTTKKRPISTIFLVPALEIKFHGYQRLVIRIPMILKPILIKVIEWYMKKNFVNPKEPEVAYKFSEKLYDIDLQKVKLSALAIDSTKGIKLSESTKLIKDKILVVGAENDLMHQEEEMVNFASFLENGEYIGLYSNYYTHGELFGRLAALYYNGKDYKFLLDEIKRDV